MRGSPPGIEAEGRDEPALTFGPVPSRRLGSSLGINNIPPKRCSYSCVYCQVGRTPSAEVEPMSLYAPSEIFEAVALHLERAHDAGEQMDYLTFVPDGEPTLDARLDESRVGRLDVQDAGLRTKRSADVV